MKMSGLISIVGLCALALLLTGCGYGHVQRENAALKEQVALLERKVDEQQARLDQLLADSAAQHSRGSRQRRATRVRNAHNMRQRQRRCQTHELMLKEEYDTLVASLAKSPAGRLDVRPECVVTRIERAIIAAKAQTQGGLGHGWFALDMKLYAMYLDADGRDDAWASAVAKTFERGFKIILTSPDQRYAHLPKEWARNPQYTLRCGRTVCLYIGPPELDGFEVLNASDVPLPGEGFGSGSGGMMLDGRTFSLMYRRPYRNLSRHEIEEVVREHLGGRP